MKLQYRRAALRAAYGSLIARGAMVIERERWSCLGERLAFPPKRSLDGAPQVQLRDTRVCGEGGNAKARHEAGPWVLIRLRYYLRPQEQKQGVWPERFCIS